MFAVIFEVEPKPERRGEYLGLAASLRPALVKIEGFVDVERYTSTSNKDRVLSLSFWRDEKAVIRWRTLDTHHDAQAKGRSGIFQDYHLRVGEVTADSVLPSGETLEQSRFDETEAGAATVVTISEFQPVQEGESLTTAGLAALSLPDVGGRGLIDCETFESIYNPGKSLVLASWRDAAAAGRWTPGNVTGATTRHRYVRVIRDYGMFDRREAPQYYPPASR